MPYIDELPVSDEVKRKIAALGASSPEALLSLAQASPDAFDAFLGSNADAIRNFLRTRVSQVDQARWSSPIPSFALGARLETRPALQEPSFDIARRDRLFDEISLLRRQPTIENQAKLVQLEADLNTLLETSSGK